MINMDLKNLQFLIETALDHHYKREKIELIDKLIIWLSNLKHDIKRGKKK